MVIAAKKEPKRTKKRSKRTLYKWKPIFLVHAYRLARAGFADSYIQQELKVSIQSFINWKKKVPELVEALEIARSERKTCSTFADYCLERMPEHLQEVWKRLEMLEKEENGVVQIEQMLSDSGKAVRQRLYIHALIACSFSPSRAGAKVGVDKRMLDGWIEEDPAFRELVEEISWHKGNFFEENLVELVSRGDTSATLFANRTWNKDRGYGNSLNVNVKGKVDVQHSVVDLAELMPFLTHETKLELLEAIRRREDAKNTQTLIPIRLSPEQVITQEIDDIASALPSV